MPNKAGKLTVGIFIEHYDPFVSGAINSVKSLRYELEKAGHTVYIVCPASSLSKKRPDTDPFIIRTPGLFTNLVDNTSIGIASPPVTKKLMNIKFDIIHGQDIYYISLLGLRIARRQNIPYIQTIHTLWDKFYDQYPIPKLYYFFGAISLSAVYLRMFSLRDLWRAYWRPKHDELGRKWRYVSRGIWQHTLNVANQASAIIVPSLHQKKALEAAGIKPPVIRVTNSITPFQPTKPVLGNTKKLRILCVSRLSNEKRVNALIEALKLTKDPSIELVVVGEGTDRAKLQQLTNQLDLNRQVRFLGSLPNMKVRQLMRESSALALASYNFDTQPMVFDEALDAGLPIVYCDPKFIEAVSPANSFLVKKDASGFAAAFRKLGDPKRRAKMSAASKALAKDFTSAKAAAQILKIYQSVIAQRAGSGSHRKP